MTFFLDQHGCAKNQVDAELLIGILGNIGWVKTDLPEEASLIIINSCGFIESAKQESLNAVMTAREAYPRAKILLAGCLAERYANDLVEGLPEADAFFGNGDLSRLPEIIDRLFPATSSDSSTSLADDFPMPVAPSEKPVLLPEQTGVCCGDRPQLLSFPRSAYVKISEGCDNRCSFCAIPLIRGGLRSRAVTEIVEECRTLIARGIWELNLIGQDLAAYGHGMEDVATARVLLDDSESNERSPLSALLGAISALEGDFRVRLLYIHPDHFPLDILPVMTADTRFFPYFDIPFQSGDAAILKRMNRHGSAETYRALVEEIRAAFAAAKTPYSTVAIRTTFLVGFPGETDESFETTARFSADIHSMWSGAFSWSCEEGTPAALLKKRVLKKTAKTRLDTLKEIQIRITPEELRPFVGKTVDVLVEEILDEQADSTVASKPSSPDRHAVPNSRLAIGRAWFQAPDVDGSVVLQFDDGQKDRSGALIGVGSIVEAYVMAVNGVDVEAVAK